MVQYLAVWPCLLLTVDRSQDCRNGLTIHDSTVLLSRSSNATNAGGRSNASGGGERERRRGNVHHHTNGWRCLRRQRRAQVLRRRYPLPWGRLKPRAIEIDIEGSKDHYGIQIAPFTGTVERRQPSRLDCRNKKDMAPLAGVRSPVHCLWFHSCCTRVAHVGRYDGHVFNIQYLCLRVVREITLALAHAALRLAFISPRLSP